MKTSGAPLQSQFSKQQLSRWMRLGPWYAMFPLDFAQRTIEEHTKPGQAVLDPFMGRGTTLAAATMLGRQSLGIEINPVAWVYAKTKVQPCSIEPLLIRLSDIATKAKDVVRSPLPEFYSWCFCDEVLDFLLVARQELNWMDDQVDRTLMALILVDLHGNVDDSLSNQMRQTKSMAPAYAIAWWQAREMRPVSKDPLEIMKRKIAWRYHHGIHSSKTQSIALLGDSTKLLQQQTVMEPFHLLLTSPPYHSVINYNYDQWLRRWMLNGPELPLYSAGQYQNRLDNKGQYRELLTSVFSSAASMLHERGRIVVRTDARAFTLESTITALEAAFPEKSLSKIHRPFLGKTQTHLFGDRSEKPGETDLILKPKRKRRLTVTSQEIKTVV